MTRIPDAFIDDRAAMTPACESAQRAAARQLNSLAGTAHIAFGER
jgi:hypothetical protein